MVQTTLRWTVPLGSLLILGPIAGWLTGTLHAANGSSDATPLVSSSPLTGLLVALLALAVAAAAGVLAAYTISTRYGLFCTGLVLAWAAWGTGTVDMLARGSGTASIFTRLAVEGLILGAAAVLVAFVIARVGKRHQTLPPSEARPSILSASSGIALALAIAAAGAAAWLIARETLKGQTFAAAAAGAVLAGVVARVGVPRVPIVPIIAGIVILAAAGPVAALVMQGGSGGYELIRAATTGRLVPIARPLPLDWIAGAFVGLPMGLSWAASLVDKHHLVD